MNAMIEPRSDEGGQGPSVQERARIMRQRISDIINENYEPRPDGLAESADWNGGGLEIARMILEEVESSGPSHVMCIGIPTMLSLFESGSVWIESVQAGAVAADDLFKLRNEIVAVLQPKPYVDPMEAMLGRPYGQEKEDVVCDGKRHRLACQWPTCGCGR